MTKVEKIHEVKIPDDTLKYGIDAIANALTDLEESGLDQHKLKEIRRGLMELLMCLTPLLHDE